MTKLVLLTALLIMLQTRHANAQHDHGKPADALTFQSVISQQLSDKDLSAYRMESSVMTILPGAQDTVSHRHDCELFGYVLQGQVRIGLSDQKPKVYKTGEMFYEKRNVLHYLTCNDLSDAETKILLFFIIKQGREGYKKEYAENAVKK